MDGTCRFDHFEGGAFLEPEVRSLLQRTASRAHNDANEYLGRVSVTLRDGTTLLAEAVTPFGRGQENPMSEAELRDKFMDCAIRSRSAAIGRSVFDAAMSFDTLKNVRQLTDILAQPGQA